MNMTIQPTSVSPLPQSSPEPAALPHEAKSLAPLINETQAVHAAQPEKSTASVTPEQLKDAVKKVQEYISPFNDALEFSQSEDTGQMVVKIIDRETKEIIRQMPSEEMIAIAKALDSIKGLFVKQSA
jgi:flagellar protein FlaG